MAFQIKSFLSIVASMVNRLRITTTLINDFNVGSVARVLVEAVAQEQDELYRQILNAVIEAIPVSVYNSFNFALLPPVAASGNYTVTITAQNVPVTIAAGTTFMSSSQANTYSSLADVTIAAGQTTGVVAVACTVAGSAGNLAAGDSGTMAPLPLGFVSAIDVSAITGGTDQETDAQRLIRFQGYITTLSRSTVAALKYGATTANLTDANGNITERVVNAVVIEPYLTDPTQSPAYVQVYVYNGVGATSAALVARATQVLTGYTNASGVLVPGWKAAGVKMDVYAATLQTFSVIGALTSAAGYVHATVVAQVTTAISTYLAGLGIGQPALLAEIIALAMGVPGVTNIVLSTPTADTAPAANTVLNPDVITIT